MLAHPNIIEPRDEDFAHVEDPAAEAAQLRQVLVHLTRLSAIGTTAAMLVHELAQPVGAASNYLAAAQRFLASGGQGSTERVQEGVRLAQECLVRASKLMGSVKEAAASKAFRARPVALKVIVGDVLRLYGAGAKVDVQVDIAPAAAQVNGDRVQLAQVLSNLIRNAAQATEGQAVRSLKLRAFANAEAMVEVHVEDNGPGLRRHLKEKLFSPFTSTKPEGLGVGLSICRTIVEQHGGRIWAETLPRGTAFCFTLVPARPDTEEGLT